MAQLEAQVADLIKIVTELRAQKSPGINHMMGRNPLAAKYAALGSQALTTLRAGQVFNDTQGKFFPIVVDKTGNVTINTSANHASSIVFHDTASGGTDALLTLFGSGQITVAPDAQDTAGRLLIANDNRVLSYNRAIAFTAPTSTDEPRIDVVESTGGRTIYKQTHIVKTKSGGDPSDSDYETPADGMIALRIDTNELFARSGGAWISVALA